MTFPGCDLLNHQRLRHVPQLRALAVDALFETALGCSARFRVEFDPIRLPRVLGPETTEALLPGLRTQESAAAPLERDDEPLDDERARLLGRVVSFELHEWTDPPINYIDRIILFDKQGKVVLRANDNAEFILFALPEDKRNDLIERYRRAGIPEDVVESVDVDINLGLSRG
jgi:hypothetical protein